MIKLTENTIKPSTEEILSIRKFLSEKFGHQRASDIWFGYFLKNLKKAEKLDKLNDAKGVAFIEGIINTEKECKELKQLLSIKEAQLLGYEEIKEKSRNWELLSSNFKDIDFTRIESIAIKEQDKTRVCDLWNENIKLRKENNILGEELQESANREKKLKALSDKIKEYIFYNSQLGGRSTLELTTNQVEKIMFLATGEYHNSKCPVCGSNVSCVCTSECNHIWYCPDHILDHSHRQIIGEDQS